LELRISRAVIANRLTDVEVETPHGPARVHLHPVEDPQGRLVLGHGAGGGVTARDLVAATKAAHAARFSVALVEQPYRVAGRKSPAPAAQLDAAWTSVVEQLDLNGLPLVTGGRSSGARVACRTAAATGAKAVLCLAFPVHPPGRPEKTRLGELDAVEVPVLVVQGESDPFGMPPPGDNREVVRLRGNHSLAGDMEGLRTAVREWLVRLASTVMDSGAVE
jgi:predicted alpha/beta-hydrolase family hydrolase